MRSSLLKIISGQKDLTNVIILTFNIDLIFVEHLLLRALKRCGHPSLTIFADAEEVSRTFESQGRWLAGIGRRYRVVPVAMSPGYRFHPKAILLSGPEQAELLIGSGNLTFGGLRQNDEVWMSFSSQEDGTGPMAAFQQMLVACADQANATRGARREVEEAFDASTRSWAGDLREPEGIIWRVGDGRSLAARMAEVIGPRQVDRILMCSPYFDEAGVALRGFAETWPDAAIDLLVQPRHSTLTETALAATATRARLLTVASGRQQDTDAFIHGKFYAVYSGEEVLLFAGSANCSVAAMGLDGKKGNAEALAYRQMSAEAFEEQVLSDLQIVDEEPKLECAATGEEDQQATIPLQIVNACYDQGVMALSFRAFSGVTVDQCWIDDETVELGPEAVAGTTISVALVNAPRNVRLGGDAGGVRVTSRSHWVDHEFTLSATSRQRKLAQAIEGSVSPASWSFRSWTEVMRLLGDHIRYEPANGLQGDHAQRSKPDVRKVYSPCDFFTSDYRLPSRRPTGIFNDEDDRILGLQHLLLDYFGIEGGESAPQSENNETLDEDEAVDVPEGVRLHKIRPATRKQQRQDLTETERKRARRIATKLIDQVLDERFLRHRSEGLLANDLTIIAVLLIAGMNEEWLASDLFFKLTYDVWTRLFFDHGLSDEEAGEAKGWLQLRAESTERSDVFKQAVGTVPLTAALAMWSFMCPDATAKPEQARFALATRMAVARLPWLWNLDRIGEVAEEIDRISTRTGWMNGRPDNNWLTIQEMWNQMLREGLALGRFEQCLKKRTPAEWREIADRGRVGPGTLIWQGKLGFGVTMREADCRSDAASAVSVLLLKAEKRQANIRPSYMLSLHQLLQAVRLEENGFRAEDAEVLGFFVEHVESLLSITSTR